MRESLSSTMSNENSNVGCNNSKRECDSVDPDLVAKKSKTEALDAENVREEAKNVADASSGGREDGRLGVLDGGNKDSEVGNQNGGSEDKRNVSEMGFVIEADAAEDKGARHKMEDAWVVLPDASQDFPGKLRCAHFAIYDGHGGRLAAAYAQKHLHANVLSAGLPPQMEI